MRKLLKPAEVVQAIRDGEKVEFRYPNNDTWHELKVWENVSLGKLLNSAWQFRLAQEMITIGDVSFPKPVSEYEKFEEGQEYFMPALQSDAFYCHSKWWHGTLDTKRLEQGIIHLTKENAIAHAKALIKLSGGKVDE